MVMKFNSISPSLEFSKLFGLQKNRSKFREKNTKPQFMTLQTILKKIGDLNRIILFHERNCKIKLISKMHMLEDTVDKYIFFFKVK